MVSEKPGNLNTIQETKTMDSQATATSNPSPMEKPTKDPNNPAPARGNLSHPGLSSMPHIMSDQQVLEEFGSSRDQGLSGKQAEAARQKWGDNIIQPPPKPSVSPFVAVDLGLIGTLSARARARKWKKGLAPRPRLRTESLMALSHVSSLTASETARSSDRQRHDHRLVGRHGRLVRYSGLDRGRCHRRPGHLERQRRILAGMPRSKGQT